MFVVRRNGVVCTYTYVVNLVICTRNELTIRWHCVHIDVIKEVVTF